MSSSNRLKSGWRPAYQKCQYVRSAVCRRHLTSAQTAIALRPFYFAVHPDFFLKFPSAQATNEDSLKKLSEYLGNLYSCQPAQPTNLLFHVRDTPTEDEPCVKKPKIITVRVQLAATNIHDVVRGVLSSCRLPLDFINTLPRNSAVEKKISKTDRPVDWHHSFYTVYGIPNPDTSWSRRRPERTLQSWLHKNNQRASGYLQKAKPARQATEQLVENIKRETGAISIEWVCGWGQTQFRGCLHAFRRLYHDHAKELQIEGYGIVFGSETGVCVQNNIILRHDDVPDNWLPMLKMARQHDLVLRKLPTVELHMSNMLGGVQVVRKRKGRTIVLAEDYVKSIRTLCRNITQYLQSHPDTILPDNMHNLEIVVERAGDKLALSREGQIHVPSSCPVFLLFEFLRDKAHYAREMLETYNRCNSLLEKLLDECCLTLGLASLSPDDNLTTEQVEACCVRLIREAHVHGLVLPGHRLNITQYYSVMSDGHMCIPWNWKNAE